MEKFKYVTLLIFASIWLFSPLTQAQDNTDSHCFNVAIANSLPWSQYDEALPPEQRQPSGFNVDLWQQVETDLNLCSQWYYAKDMTDIIVAVNTGKVDVGLVNFPASSALQLGLQTATIAEYSVAQIAKQTVVKLTSYIPWRIVLMVFSGLFILACIRWFIDRFQPEEYRRFKRNFFRDYFEVVWWNINLVIGWEGFDTSRGIVLVFDFILHIIGLALLGSLLSILAVSLSLEASNKTIYTQEEVDGRVVAVMKDSPYVKHYLKQRSPYTKFVEVDTLQQGFDLLRTYKADALVHNSIELKSYYSQQNLEELNIKLLPTLFNYQQYGIILEPDSVYQDAISEQLARYNEPQGLEASFISRLSKTWGILVK